MEFRHFNRWLSAIANVGVLAGLVVLIFELKQNNELTMAQIEQIRSDTLLQWRQEWVLNDHIAPLLTKASELEAEFTTKSPFDLSAEELQRVTEQTLEALEPVEGRRLRYFIMRDYWDFENLYFQFKRGLISEGYWHDRIVPAIAVNAPRWKAVLGGNLPRGGRQEFNEEIERVLRDAE